ncbi:hypothetical protein GCM10010994_51200 [Chelatococcus reniformis]|uniref:Uncharacterized protein n=1 Tax=Chelatococcus reniformis TaxID=1494448 RepID=A0A916UTF6_9HYPH|nr:hypothetical protein GCM10010994_51200 [Chelatococcus reniformis]
MRLYPSRSTMEMRTVRPRVSVPLNASTTRRAFPSLPLTSSSRGERFERAQLFGRDILQRQYLSITIADHGPNRQCEPPAGPPTLAQGLGNSHAADGNHALPSGLQNEARFIGLQEHES